MPKEGTAQTDVEEGIEGWFADVQLVVIGPFLDGVRGCKCLWRRK